MDPSISELIAAGLSQEELNESLCSRAREMATEDIDNAIKVRETLVPDLVICRAFDQGLMPIAAKARPRLVLEAIRAGGNWGRRLNDERCAMMALVKEDPERAAELMTEEGSILTQWRIPLEHLGKYYAGRDSGSGMGFMGKILDPGKRAWAMAGLYSGLAERDWEKTEALLHKLKAGHREGSFDPRICPGAGVALRCRLLLLDRSDCR